ncbi:MAG TPA: HPF/RaiA family ribosome-associated protein [Alphaproteobacteria bacterium]|jgi:ribosomal subunit interface protein
MAIPVHITFRDIDPSDAVEARIRERAARLEPFADRATSLHVIVAAPHARGPERSHKGRPYQFTLELMMPKGDIVIRQGGASDLAHGDVYVAMRDAFDALERRVHEHNEKLGH